MSQITKSETIRIDTSLLDRIGEAIKLTPEYSNEREFLESAGREKLAKFGGN